MAVSDSQKVDLLYKQAFGVTKTDTAANKSPSNEALASPLVVRGDTIWIESSSIPATASPVANIVEFTGTNGVECVADTTTVPVGGVYPTWKTNLSNWINTEFGVSYLVKVYVDNPGSGDPASTGTQIFAAGSGGTGEYYFNHSSGVLNFIGGTIPAALTSGKVIYIVGYRYIGKTGVKSDWITTANVAESASNLYYTNERVYANVAEMLPNYTGNIQAQNINISGLLTGDGSGLTGVNASGYTGTTDAISEGSVNLFYTDERVEAYVRPNLESNLVLKANVVDLTTSNVAELDNLYYTNDRVSAYVTPLLDLKADKTQLNTTSITEGNKLFYTNARVYANVIALLPTYSGNINAGNINIAGTFTGNGSGLVGITAGAFTGNTDTVREGLSNLYYSNARVAAYISANLTSKANVVDLTTANVAELNNLYYTNTRVQAYLEQAQDIIPATGFTYDLGSETNPWRDLWLSGSTLRLGNLVLRDSGGTLAVTSGNANTIALVTSGVRENGDTTKGNVYFTNARVFGAITNQDVTLNTLTLLGDLFVQGNTTTLNTATVNIEDKNLLIANGAVNAAAADGAGITIDGANATFTYSSAGDNFDINKPLVTRGNVVLHVGNSTSDLQEGSNLYYTEQRANDAIDARVTKAFVDNLNVDADTLDGYNSSDFALDTDLTTANVAELNNLYYTNARVQAYLQDQLDSKANVVDLTTANVAELNNLYYTNARVDAYVTPYLNLKANVADLNSSNIIEGDKLFYTNARVQAFVQANIDSKANVVDLTTSNVAEGSQLYYTNARVRSTLAAGLGVTYNEGTGTFSIGQDVAPSANVTFRNLAVTGNAVFYGNVITYGANNLVISDNMIYLNDDSNSNPDLGIAANYNDGTYKHTGFFRDASDGNWKVYDSYIPEPDANIFIDTSHPSFRLANIQANVFIGEFHGDVKGNILGYIASISNFTTSDLKEGANLYYTEARANGAIDARVTKAFVDNLNVDADTLDGYNSSDFALDTDLTTANVAELNNLYYTNARVQAYIQGNLDSKANVVDLTTSNVAEGTQLYYTNARVDAWVAPKLAANLVFKANVVDLTTANIAELNNLYYTNARVYGNVVESLTNFTANIVPATNGVYNLGSSTKRFKDLWLSGTTLHLGNISLSDSNGNLQITSTSGPGQLLTDVVTANVWNYIYTANVIETPGNLYFTNTRVFNAITNQDLSLNNLTLLGDLFVQGNTVALNTATLNVEDKNIVLANGAVNGAAADGAGITVQGADANITYSVSGDKWTFNKPIESATVIANEVQSKVWTGIYTANVVESPSALYYTDTRAYANLLQASINALADVDTVSVAPVTGQSLIWNGSSWAPSSVGGSAFAETANVANTVLTISNFSTTDLAEGSQLYYTNARVDAWIAPNLASNLVPKANVVDLTTANVAELDNLYYTNARVDAWVAPKLAANLVFKANVVDLTTANVAELDNLYYTNTRVDAYVTPFLNLKANVVDLTTSNVAEGSQLYYTNTRVHANVMQTLVPYATKVYVDESVANLVAGAPAVLDTLYELANALGNDASFATTVTNTLATKAKSTDLTTANVVELNNLYYTDDRVYANVVTLLPEYAGNIGADYVIATRFIGNGSLLSGVTATGFSGNTDLVAEGLNLYYTNARVDAYVTPSLNLKANVVDLTTSNVAEGTNLYFTNARVQAFVQANVNSKANVVDLTTANITELTNLFYTNARVAAFVTPNLNLKANVVDLTTSNVAEGTQLYYSNARVDAWLAPNLAANLVPKANVVDLTTANVAERNNLYYTNARVDAWLVPNLASNLVPKANVVDLTTSNVVEGTQLYFTNTRVFDAITSKNVTFNDLTLLGDLIVQGNTTTLNTATVIVEDKNILIANGAVSAAAADGAGITIMGANANILYRSTGDKFTVDRPLEVQGSFVLTQGTTTTDIPEGANLYYTDARVYANIAAANISILNDVDTENYPPQEGYVLKWVNGYWVANSIGLSSVETAQLADVANTAVLAQAANIANLVVSITNFTTSDLREGSNLYYTNARVASNVITTVPTILPTYTGNVKAGNVNVSGAVHYANSTGVLKVYQVYNEITNSLDTVFA